jgi:hypothetical protein
MSPPAGVDRIGRDLVDAASSGARSCVTEDMSEIESRPALAVPTPTEIAASLPAEAVQYDPERPPAPGSVQRDLQA